MCRIAAFPPHFPQDRALEIMLEMEGTNIDGVGSAYIGGDGKFVLRKWPISLTRLMEKGEKFLENMAGDGHNGWTIVHMRLKSLGDVAPRNTHPWIIDNKWAFCHNGTWHEHRPVRLALGKVVKFEGETDSEVAGHLFNTGGPRAFCDVVDTSGVMLGLRKDGALYVVNTGARTLKFCEINKEKQMLVSSELEYKDWPKADSVQLGWYYFNKDGKLIESGKKSSIVQSNGHHYNSSVVGGEQWLTKSKNAADSAKVIEAEHDDEYTSAYGG